MLAVTLHVADGHARTVLPIGAGFGWARAAGSLDGAIRPGWRLWVALVLPLSDVQQVSVTGGIQHFHFPPEHTGGPFHGTSDTLETAEPATMGFLQVEARRDFAPSRRIRPYVQAGVGIGYMTFGYSTVGPDSSGLWGDGVIAVDVSVGAGATHHLGRYLDLFGELRVDAVGHLGVGMLISSANAGAIVRLPIPGLPSEVFPSSLRGRSLRRP